VGRKSTADQKAQQARNAELIEAAGRVGGPKGIRPPAPSSAPSRGGPPGFGR
jgi:hypothetical protein